MNGTRRTYVRICDTGGADQLLASPAAAEIVTTEARTTAFRSRLGTGGRRVGGVTFGETRVRWQCGAAGTGVSATRFSNAQCPHCVTAGCHTVSGPWLRVVTLRHSRPSHAIDPRHQAANVCSSAARKTATGRLRKFSKPRQVARKLPLANFGW